MCTAGKNYIMNVFKNGHFNCLNLNKIALYNTFKNYGHVYLFANKLCSNYWVLGIILGLDDKNSLWPQVLYIIIIKENNKEQTSCINLYLLSVYLFIYLSI